MLKKIAALKDKLGPGLRQVLSNTAWLFADRILQLGMGLLVGAWVARYLGPDQFGLLNYAAAFASLFSPLANLGLDGIVVRDIARDVSSKDETLGTAFVLKLIGGILTFLFSVGTISVIGSQDPLMPWLVGIIAAGGVFQAFGTIEFWFRAQLQAKNTLLAKRSAYIFISIVKIILILQKAPLIWFAVVMTAETALAGLGLVIAYQTQGYAIQAWRNNYQKAKNLLVDSWPLLLSGLTVYIYSKIDQVMLGSLVEDQSQLAFYAIAVKLSETFDFIPVMINTSLLPKLTEIKQKGEEDYQKNFQLYFDVMLGLWLAVAIPMSVLSPWIVGGLYGPKYAASASILSIYVWAQFGSNFGVARSAYLLIEGKQKWALFFSLSGAIINIVLNAFMIPRYGAVGATIATLVTYFIVTVLLNFFIRELRPVSKWILRSFNVPAGILRLLALVR